MSGPPEEPQTQAPRPKWDEYFLQMANLVSTRSKDESTRVGCVIVGPGMEVRSTGYNGFPRGINDEAPERHERPEKYLWTEHAERNAIYNAARMGTPLLDCTMYLPWFPCMDCARAIIQSGIETLVCEPEGRPHRHKYAEEMKKARVMLLEAGVTVTDVDRG